jgi:aspartate carbamoyltransferase catalytic subunit
MPESVRTRQVPARATAPLGNDAPVSWCEAHPSTLHSNPAHILDAAKFSREWLEHDLYPLASHLQQFSGEQLPHLLSGKLFFYLLYQPCSRTRVAFETAATILGGRVSGVDANQHDLGEDSLEDRIRILNEYPVECMLFRHCDNRAADRVATLSRATIISAGDGHVQPTQALLDGYTIWQELGHLDNLTFAMVGDLSSQQAATSLAYLLGRFSGITIYLVSPRLLRMHDKVRDYLGAMGARVEEILDVREIATALDVVYLTHAQSTRFEHACRFDSVLPAQFAVDEQLLELLPEHARILHPLPRGNELAARLDCDRRVACFRQAGNELFVQMALLMLLTDLRGSQAV